MTKASASLFKSSEGEAKYMAAYDAALALWGVAYECLKVPTRFGITHVVASGPKDAPALVLLHGMGVSSTVWFPNIADLSQECRTFAVDVIGDPGRSVPNNLPKDRSESGEWLLDVFKELHIGQAHVVGSSYGGFLTLNFALHAPDRVNRIVLLAPAASLLRIRIGFWLRMLPLLVLPTRPILDRVSRWLSVRQDVSKSVVVEQMFLSMRHRKRTRRVWPGVFTDEELRSVGAPTLLLIGEQEVIYEPRAAMERATRCIPHIEAEIIPNAGHALSFDQPKSVDTRVLRFLKP